MPVPPRACSRNKMQICVFSRAILLQSESLCARGKQGDGNPHACRLRYGKSWKPNAKPASWRGAGKPNWLGGSRLDPPSEREPEQPAPITLAEAGIDKHLADRAVLAGLRLTHAPTYAEGNPTARLTATTAGLPHVEDLLHYQRQSLVLLSTFL
jgi:hypothetical protein